MSEETSLQAPLLAKERDSKQGNGDGALAYDGSGKAGRNGKHLQRAKSIMPIYQLRIGARYFVRGIEKSMSETKWLSLQANVPDVAKRTYTTLSSLTSLTKALESPKAT
ncbi:hypothetical protein HUG15_11615 [Salicibibacter cibarius]|uniref:Uncharacterized protein n=1 Tax=Salicibibacter cibarius TaxID=2743000 RepID=A0A7T6Z378_9BACI|nr:hypothetical protein [Salicibibacter cibarius]QQK76140.1 hypothetical protein HUG15_11615 [Salicibibacter cibarius]